MVDSHDLLDARVIILSTLVTSTVIGSMKLYKKFQPIRSIHSIPKAYFHNKTLYGYVTRVGDGDNFHFYHTPGGRWLGWGTKYRPLPKKHYRGIGTLPIRLCGIDAPERSHFGKPAQLFSDEALMWLKLKLLHKNVRMKPLCIDQYERVVGHVQVREWLIWRDVGRQMLRTGLCSVYEGSQVEFDGMERVYRQEEKESKRKKRGMWSVKTLTPREYKRIYNKH
ncbi:Lcl3p [Cyberlindnera jadinii NRRL Y-1542]|uniref:Probable endonuclease LCL3 n=1 Tax=Cyberlindnera jadinii (strain ATCC 18201 / CBS 1600 / BCRC 20928 / JCM 3617 / NBRC 0987 / NRRL Y-1542) TaxID=983966 RepID=A0A1E4RZC9_CYBJN|nr:endonuclease [Cyberlindnera jadinii NRRL Y-1542]ODV72515.1 endonuclease [Cyberlindnera jadinii NRRL Y-1542]